MKKVLLKLKIVSLIIIGLWFTRSIIFRLLNIDFVSSEIAENFKLIWLILIPLAIGNLLVLGWEENKPNIKEIIGVSAGMLISVATIIVFNFLSGFCAWHFSEPIYRHKSENIEIRERTLNCGAWDSDPACLLVETRQIGNYLISYKEIKKEEIDFNVWILE